MVDRIQDRVQFKPWNLARGLIWGGFALILIAAPLAFGQGGPLSIMCQMGTAMIFGLSYNMLLGQGGMLSFGHAVYSGLGAFIAIHVMNMTTQGRFWLAIELIPLVGGVAGLFFGILSGYVTTKKAGTTFSMITLGMVELVFACSLMFPGFFGGEGGVATNRTAGHSLFGMTYGPQIQVYYLIAFWLFVCTIAMYAFTQTPLGRLINAVRDNPERVEFIGYDTQWVRYLTLVLSAFFAGVSGALAAINFEIVSAENVSAIRSGSVLLFTFIGGIGFFSGPMLGAIAGIFMSVILSGVTKAWQLYLGAFFIFIVMFAPTGIAGIVMLSVRMVRFRQSGLIWRQLPPLGVAAGTALSGCVMLVEMLYHLTMDAANGAGMTWFGLAIDTGAAGAWVLAASLIAVGGLGFKLRLPGFKRTWDQASQEMAAQVRRVDA